MWWVGISVSPCADAERMGIDSRQINRIVIRMAQFILNRSMRVVFGHNWREDGVMEAVFNYAIKVASGRSTVERKSDDILSDKTEDSEEIRMLNVVPVERNALSRVALDAQRESDGILKVLTVNEVFECLKKREPKLTSQFFPDLEKEERANELTKLRLCLTALLDPGCRICLGGKTSGFQGKESGIIEEARLALDFGKPLYLLGGFGGATKLAGENDDRMCMRYWQANNGLSDSEKQELVIG